MNIINTFLSVINPLNHNKIKRALNYHLKGKRNIYIINIYLFNNQNLRLKAQERDIDYEKESWLKNTSSNGKLH